MANKGIFVLKHILAETTHTVMRKWIESNTQRHINAP